MFGIVVGVVEEKYLKSEIIAVHIVQNSHTRRRPPQHRSEIYRALVARITGGIVEVPVE
jgi:hypothetical protein